MDWVKYKQDHELEEELARNTKDGLATMIYMFVMWPYISSPCWFSWTGIWQDKSFYSGLTKNNLKGKKMKD